MKPDYKEKIFEYCAFFLTITVFFAFFIDTLSYGRTYDDDALLNKFTRAPGDAKLLSSFLYAKFHFYPIYFLTHELDNFITYLLNYFNFNVFNTQIAKFTNSFLHLSNSFLIYYFLKIIFKINFDLKKNILLYFSTLSFLFHPITSQVIFNITTRNESLALFFGLLTFIYSLNHFNHENYKNYFFISILFFFSLCSKLMTIFFIGLIPVTIFLLNFHSMNLRKNIVKNFKIFFTLVISLVIYYYLRNIFTEKNELFFYNNLYDISFYFFTTIKFYLIGLFFPYEHIYVYANNYDLKFSILLFILFLMIFMYSIHLFYKNKDPYILIAFIWICASLSLPVLFGLIEKGFPLISNLAERYQYSSVVSLTIIISWIFLNNLSLKKIYRSVFCGTLFIGIIFFSIFILKDRSYVYLDNNVFMSEIDEKSPRNVHRYAFTNNIKQSIISNDEKKYLFNLYQLYSLEPYHDDSILEFLRYQILLKNKNGINYFENKYKDNFKDSAQKIFKLAKFYYFFEEYEKSQNTIEDIFEKYNKLIEEKSRDNIEIIPQNPSVDDLYFELGKIEFSLENYPEALNNFKEAYLYNPYHATALYNSAITLKKLGLFKEATKAFEDSIKINPFLREHTKNKLINNIE